ncbi:MAG: cell wall-binding repeat-containing protein [Oscillospiraceae bacterium]|jgi:putative cell wall-binding protein|nr:cell wall-binding repeat-containing protein [Oscillospiraceae bacterium]
MASIFFALPIASNVYADSPLAPPIIVRIGGSNRYTTAISISNEGWSNANTVVLASGTNFADGLAGAPLAKSLDAPILLTAGGTSLETDVANKIATLGTQNVVILGGDSSVSNAIETALNATQGITSVERLSGANRYATAAAIAQKMDTVRGSAPTAVFVADGTDFPDGLAAGAAAAVLNAPLLFTHKGDPNGSLHVDTAAYLNGLSTAPANGYAAGGSVPNNAFTQLSNYVNSTERLSGTSRYETALRIYQKFQDDFNSLSICYALGSSFPDTLAGSALAAKLDSPLILVNDYHLCIDDSPYTSTILHKSGYTCLYEDHTDNLDIPLPDVPNFAYVFGGPSVPAEQVSVNPATAALYPCDTQTIIAMQDPPEANSFIAWSSSNTATATVSATGVVTAVAPGTAKIWAEAVNCRRAYYCEVTVLQHVTSVSLRIKKISIGVGGTAAVTADVLPANAANKTVTWSSNNPAVATVNATTGVITGVSGAHGGSNEGSFATITARTADGGKTATCQVHVYPAAYFGEDDQKPVTPTLNSNDYQNLTSKKDRFLTIAKTQIGYRNGHDSGWHTTVIFPYSLGSGWSKYPSYYNSTIQNDHDLAWCASFVSWCAELAEVGTERIIRSRGANMQYGTNQTYRHYYSLTSANLSSVKMGDLVYFKDNDPEQYIDHIGIVREDYVSGGIIKTIEGNTQNGAGGTPGYCANRERLYNASGFVIVGFSHWEDENV